jgi:hypothetical protein
MRNAVTLLLLTPALFLDFGCGCNDGFVSSDCVVSGDLQVRASDGTTHDRVGLPADNLCAFSYYGRTTDQELVVVLSAPITTGAAARFVDLRLTVLDVPEGPSEIELDDTRATIDEWGDIQGHISIATLTRDRTNGPRFPLTTLHATLALSATNAAGETLTLSVTLDLRETYGTHDIMCPPGDGIGA